MNFFQRIPTAIEVLFGRLVAVYEDDLEAANAYAASLEARLKAAESA